MNGESQHSTLRTRYTRGVNVQGWLGVSPGQTGAYCPVRVVPQVVPGEGGRAPVRQALWVGTMPGQSRVVRVRGTQSGAGVRQRQG